MRRTQNVICIAFVALVTVFFGLSSCQAEAPDTAPPALKLSIEKLDASLLDSSGASIATYGGTYPETLLDLVDLSPGAKLEVTLRAKKGSAKGKIQQVMLMLTLPQASVSVYAAAKQSKPGVYTFSISSALIEKQLGHQGGVYDAVLLLGDSEVPEGISWPLGTLEFKFEKVEKIIRPITARTQNVTNVKPVIEHIFRTPDKRAPATVSLVFAALAFVPLLITLLTVASMKINFKAFPTDSSTALAAVLFHVGIGSILALYMLFWLKLNLAQTLPAAILGGMFVWFTGYKALSGLSNARLLLKKNE